MVPIGLGMEHNLLVKVGIVNLFWFALPSYEIDDVISALDCGPTTPPDNGQVDTANGTTFKSVATFSCNTGYILSHQQVIVCEADGMWSPASPSCTGRNDYNTSSA